jgi:hypothetical protein
MKRSGRVIIRFGIEAKHTRRRSEKIPAPPTREQPDRQRLDFEWLCWLFVPTDEFTASSP